MKRGILRPGRLFDCNPKQLDTAHMEKTKLSNMGGSSMLSVRTRTSITSSDKRSSITFGGLSSSFIDNDPSYFLELDNDGTTNKHRRPKFNHYFNSQNGSSTSTPSSVGGGTQHSDTQEEPSSDGDENDNVHLETAPRCSIAEAECGNQETCNDTNDNLDSLDDFVLPAAWTRAKSDSKVSMAKFRRLSLMRRIRKLFQRRTKQSTMRWKRLSRSNKAVIVLP